MEYLHFSDGSKLLIFTTNVPIGSDILTFNNLIIQAKKNGDYIAKVDDFSKTDLDGNVWRFNQGSISVKSTDGTVYITMSTANEYVYVSRGFNGHYLLLRAVVETNTLPDTTIDNVYGGVAIDDYSYFADVNFYQWIAKGLTPRLVFNFLTNTDKEFVSGAFDYDNPNGSISSLFTTLRSARTFGTDLSANGIRFTNSIYEDSEEPIDPFAPGGTSEPGGGGGTFDDESDEIPDSSLPTLSAANTGFTRIYNPTLSQVQAMANYLWTDDSVIETIWNHIKQFLEDPMDAFIAFNLIPCAVPNGGTSNFKVMYIDTGVAMTTAANQFVDVDCGTVQLDRYYGSALDYTPYTRVGCFLPYIGTVELDTDEVMGATLQVKYRIDIVSGACVAKIFVDGSCIYQYSGHCAINIPFTSADFSNYVNAIIQVAKAGLIAASGVPITAAGAGEAAEQLTGRTVTTTKTTQRNPATGRQIVTGTETTERGIYSTEASFKGLSPTNLANTVGAVMGSKPMIEHSGGFNGNSGYLGIRRPFLIIKRPRMCNPSGYGTLNGYPCMIKETLGNLSGFTQVQQVQLTGLSATNPEQAEILQLLKQGVIL